MKTTQEIFSNNLVNMLIAKDKTQSDLARFLKTTPNTVSKWALGKSMPRPKMLDGICRFLNCTQEDLLTDHSQTVVLLPEDVIADEIHNNPRLFQLFVSAIGAEDEDIVHCIEYLNGARK